MFAQKALPHYEQTGKPKNFATEPANALLLLDDGKSCQVIAEFLYLDDDTVRGWHKTYRENGWDALAADGWKGGQSRMAADQEAALCDWLDGRFCHSSVEIRAHVSTKFGLRYSHSGCIKLLARLGFEYRKPKALPRVVSAEKQAAFMVLSQSFLSFAVTRNGAIFCGQP
ncbi:helix-turn-helix domain-containing protein [Octadecabacter arcticus]|uniref:helix-turn-helix domain-containing protein n=1 Tax=Octadecabacter arcticus TaxID=53946 RepID=UPI0005C60E99|nr:winged helix-turn-helix domain-containing protein [Octadecabacter arcticus]